MHRNEPALQSDNLQWWHGGTVHENTGDFGEKCHYNDVIMNAMASQITSLTIVYATVYSGSNQRKHQRPATLAFVRGIQRWPVNSPRKGSTRKNFPFDDVIICTYLLNSCGMWELVFIKLRTRIGYTLNDKNTSLCEYKLNQNSTIFMQWMNLEASSAKWQIFFLGLTWLNEYLYQLIATEWRIYASVRYAIIGADFGLSPVWLTQC